MRQRRWLELINNYNLEVHYHLGKHYYKKDLLQPFENTLRGGQEYQPPWLMARIN
jgi:hypothetical protein